MPRLIDIAREAGGVSEATVSRVLNGKPGGVNDVTRRSVLEVARSSGGTWVPSPWTLAR